MLQKTLKTQLCVVGGGLAGMCAAIAAARRGVQVVLVNDRPVLGGNASSEIRMWICGSRGLLETGLVEEFKLANYHRNPNANFSIWDSVLYEHAYYQENLTLLLNASCCDATVSGPSERRRIHAIKVWQLTTYTEYTVEADWFVDASGDSILAEPSGAEFRVGHEPRAEFDESIAPVEADRKTMGMSCLLQAREYPEKQSFIPPSWATVYPDDESLFHREHVPGGTQNYWWIELGGEDDSLHDTEAVRARLLPRVFGVWDHLKNRGDHPGSENWDIEWVGFLPGKRESRRYVGDWIVHQSDVENGGRFEDVIAYAGWPMDDHHPAGFDYPGEPTIFHPAPAVFGLPYRAVYSKNVDNLWMAGRNISISHVALSSTRVMATCALLGEAVGVAASIAVREKISPRAVGQLHLNELQQELLDNDCYLPGVKRLVSAVCRAARLTASAGDPEPLRNGVERGSVSEVNYWAARRGDVVEYRMDLPVEVSEIRLVLDSDLENRHRTRDLNVRSNYPLSMEKFHTPETLLKSFRISAADADGVWHEIAFEQNNFQRLRRFAVQGMFTGVKLEVLDGETPKKIYGFDFR